MNATWLFAEAYKYRRLRECFSVSKYWRDYDVFFRQKVHSISSRESNPHLMSVSVRYIFSLYGRCVRAVHPLRRAFYARSRTQQDGEIRC